MSCSAGGIVLTSIMRPVSMEAGADEWLMIVLMTLIMVRLILELGLGVILRVSIDQQMEESMMSCFKKESFRLFQNIF